jgi:hypothetical protein
MRQEGRIGGFPMNRVTKKELEQLVDVMNRREVDKPRRLYPELGCYYLMGAYGGQKLVQIVNKSGGVRDVFPHLGYTSKKELAQSIRAFLEGRSELEEEQRRGFVSIPERGTWSMETLMGN